MNVFSRLVFFFCTSILLLTSSCENDQPQKIKTTTTKTEKKLTSGRNTTKPITKSQKTTNKEPLRINKNQENKKINYRNINLSLIETLIHQEINKARKANGAAPLSNDLTLRKAAEDQNNYCVRNTDLSHTQPTSEKRTIKDRVQYYGQGYSMMAENLIYEGFTVRRTDGKISDVITPTYRKLAKTMVVNWMKSPGHRQNIVEKELKRVGTAVAYNPKNHAIYATQVFGTKLGD